MLPIWGEIDKGNTKKCKKNYPHDRKKRNIIASSRITSYLLLKVVALSAQSQIKCEILYTDQGAFVE